MKRNHILRLLFICFLIQPVIYGQVKSSKTNISKGHQLYKTSKIKIKQSQQSNTIVKPSQIRDKASDRFFYELDRTCDPMTRQIPEGIEKKEESFIQNKKSLKSSTISKMSNTNWINRGPFNVGGRTRALAIDMSNENVILAGGVSGGLWRSEDGGQNWNKVTRKFQNPSVTAIVQDPRPGHQHIWYYGGGERLGNSANFNAVTLYTGVGIYKSQDSGRTWELLPSTVDNTVLTASPFDIVNSMVINPTNGDLYIATFNGIHRSQDDGNSFQEVLTGGIDKRTEVAVTKQGKLYASVADRDFNTVVGGVYTSDEGTNWTRISNNITDLNRVDRTIFAINPSNENEVYVYSTFASRNRLFKYNAIDQTFIDLSEQLPVRSGLIGGLVTQGAYNMVIAVHPTNPEFIIIGGTNLFRTTDGFRTKIDDTPNNWIGGYSPRNDVSLYPDQHPDMHALVFFPSNPNKVLNANDGGVFMTEDITTSSSFEMPVDWISLNNGYVTTQPYAVSFDPNAENEDLLAGFQDNGTWFTDQKNTTAFWEEEFGGDGSYNAFADNGLTRYVSSQRGNVFRLNNDANGNTISLSWVRPAGIRSFAFITPFVLNPNNDNEMYLPAETTLLRNSNLDEIPSVATIDDLTAPTDVNWSETTKVESILDPNSGRELNTITALDISTFPEANKVYYGTGQGQIFRLDFANLPSSKPVDIFTGKGLPERGFISSIQVDPNNSDRVLVTFSNYNIPSIFLSENAGETWINISGNLEENKDGTGNGPSVRWTSFLGNKDGILAGTSSGLYYTKKILNENTVWQLENNQIGDGVVMQVRTRKDGFAALAVHGNGVFSKKFNVTPPRGEKTLVVNKKPDDIILSIEETPQFMTVDVNDVFRDQFDSNSTIDITVESSDKDRSFIGYEFFNNQLEIFFFGTNRDVPNVDKEGKATIRLTATSGIERLATEFKVQVVQKPFLNRFDENKLPYRVQFPSSEVSETDIFGNPPSSVELADQIKVPSGKKWTIERMKILAGADPFTSDIFPPGGNTARIRIYQDENGKPGKQIANMVNKLRKNPLLDVSLSILGDLGSPSQIGEFDLVLPNKVELTEGKYWISFTRLEEIYAANNIVWAQQIRTFGGPEFDNINESVIANKPNPHYRSLEGSLFKKTWEPFENLDVLLPTAEYPIENQSSQLLFSLFGEVDDINTIKSKNRDLQTNVVISPNPTDEIFNIQFSRKLDEDILVKIMDLTGNEIFRKNFDKKETSYSIETSGFARGIYIVSINGNTIKTTTKMVRR